MSEEKANCAKLNGNVLLINGGLEKALEKLAQPPYVFGIESVYCIGGASVYSQALKQPCVRTLRSVSYTRIYVINDACTHFFHFPPRPQQATCHHINNTSRHVCNYSVKKSITEPQSLHEVTNNNNNDCEGDNLKTIHQVPADNTNLSDNNT